jgi:hypothetical protein
MNLLTSQLTWDKEVSKPSLAFEDQPVIVTWNPKTHVLYLHGENRRIKTLQNQAINVDSAFRSYQWRWQWEGVTTFLTNSPARSNFDGLETKTALCHGNKSTWRFLGRWSQLKVSQYTSGFSRLREDLWWSPPTPKARRNRSLTTWRHTIADALTHEATSSLAWDDSEECFRLGQTCALVPRKRREVRLQI